MTFLQISWHYIYNLTAVDICNTKIKHDNMVVLKDKKTSRKAYKNSFVILWKDFFYIKFQLSQNVEHLIKSNYKHCKG